MSSSHQPSSDDEPNAVTEPNMAPSHTCNPGLCNNGPSVVIVGGCVIGLCTAYQLAKSTKAKRSRPRIIVLEANILPSSAVSSHNTGCLHFGCRELHAPLIHPLCEYSFNVWKEIAHDDPTFVPTTGYRPQSIYTVSEGVNNGDDGCDSGVKKTLPNWVKPGEGWMLGMGEHRGFATMLVNKLEITS